MYNTEKSVLISGQNKQKQEAAGGRTVELFNLRYVVAVAETGNFTQAAEQCHVGQPALSQQIAKLEGELGLKLFYRDPHSVTLTEAGAEFVRRAREILDKADALEIAMGRYTGLRKGTLNLGIITSLECIDFGGRLSDFCNLYPEVLINLTESGSYNLLEMLRDRRVHVALLNRPIGNIPAGIEFHKLGQDSFSLAVPKNHPLAGKKMVSLKQVANESFIFHGDGQVAAQLCMQACHDAGFEPNIVCRSANPTTDLYMVRGGLGITFLPKEEFRSHLMRNVVEVPLKESIVKEVGICWRKEDSSPLVKAVIDHSIRWRGEVR